MATVQQTAQRVGESEADKASAKLAGQGANEKTQIVVENVVKQAATELGNVATQSQQQGDPPATTTTKIENASDTITKEAVNNAQKQTPSSVHVTVEETVTQAIARITTKLTDKILWHSKNWMERVSEWWSGAPATETIVLSQGDIAKIGNYVANTYPLKEIRGTFSKYAWDKIKSLWTQVKEGEIAPEAAKEATEEELRAEVAQIKHIYPKFITAAAGIGIVGAAAFTLFKRYWSKRRDTARVRYLENKLKRNPSVKNVTKLVKEVIRPKRPRSPIKKFVAPKYLTNVGFPVVPRKRLSAKKKRSHSKKARSKRRR